MPKGQKRPPRQKGGWAAKLRNIRLGDIGEAIAGAWEGIGKVTGFNQEIKRLDTEVAVQGCTNGGVMTPISLIAEGSDFNQRDGHSIKAISLELRAAFYSNAVAISNVIRLILFLDLEQQGVIPTTAQVLETAAGAAQQPLTSFQHDNTERFVILADELVALNSMGPGAAQRTLRLPLGSHIRFSGSTAVIAAAREGHLFVLIVGDQAVNAPYCGFYSRLSYVDN